MPREWRVYVDACFRDGIAAVAAVEQHRDVRILFADVCYCEDNMHAELTALVEAFRLAHRAKWRKVIFLTDSLGLLKTMWNNNEAALLLRSHRLDWKVEHIKRTHNSAAHTAASQAFKMWHAGREHRTTVDPA